MFQISPTSALLQEASDPQMLHTIKLIKYGGVLLGAAPWRLAWTGNSLIPFYIYSSSIFLVLFMRFYRNATNYVPKNKLVVGISILISF